MSASQEAVHGALRPRIATMMFGRIPEPPIMVPVESSVDALNELFQQALTEVYGDTQN